MRVSRGLSKSVVIIPRSRIIFIYNIQAGLTMYFSIHSTHGNSLNFHKQTTR